MLRVFPFALILTLLPLPAPAGDVTACNPVGFPCFTVDRASPVVSPTLRPGDLLVAPGPAVFRPAAFFGLNNPFDDLDGVSRINGQVDPTATFLLLFSVDRRTRGVQPPDPNLVALGYPFNVRNQAQNNQAAADAFAGLNLFDRSGAIPPAPRPADLFALVGGGNNTLFINQGDASGIDFAVGPNESPATPVPDPESNVNGMAGTGAPSSPRPLGLRHGLSGTHLGDSAFVFTVRDGSPSLGMLPGTGSGADIYVVFDPNDPNLPGAGIFPYALADTLDLNLADDIDALLVFDDGDLAYNSQADQIVFSLARGSPTLALLGLSPADLISARPGQGLNVYAAAGQLGLGITPDPNDPGQFTPDNIDALDFVLCSNRRACLLGAAIGFPCAGCPGDVNGDNVVDLNDLAIVLGNFGLGGAVREDGDLNGDGQVTLADLAEVLANFGRPCQ